MSQRDATMTVDAVIISFAESLGRFRALTDMESDLLYKAIDRERRRSLRCNGLQDRQTRPWMEKEIRAVADRVKRGGSINGMALELSEKPNRTDRKSTRLNSSH